MSTTSFFYNYVRYEIINAERHTMLKCSLLEGRTQEYLNRAGAPARKLVREQPYHLSPRPFLVSS